MGMSEGRPNCAIISILSGNEKFSVHRGKGGHAKLNVVARALTIIGRHGHRGVAFSLRGQGTRSNDITKYLTRMYVPSNFIV